MTIPYGPSLYAQFSREEALRLVGGKDQPRLVCDGQWAIFADAVACIATIDTSLLHSHFDTGSCFCWVADKPYHARKDKYVTFLPDEDEVVAGTSDSRPIHLFVRQAESPIFLYVGELEPSAAQRLPGSGTYGEAHFNLRPTLPSNVWERFGFKIPQEISDSTLDAQIARLAGQTTLDERFDILKTVVEYWHGKITPEDGFTNDELRGIPMPDALLRWFLWAGKRKTIMSGQNSLIDPTILKAEDGQLVFYGENQWCYEWATSIEGVDPPVVGRSESSKPWKPQGLRVSEHLVLACLFEATMCHAKYGASVAWLEEGEVDWIRQRIPAVPLSSWTWGEECRFFAGDDRFMLTMKNGTCDGVLGYSVWIGAKTETPLSFLKGIIDNTWDYVSL